jgi:hypothetical protein
VAGLWWIRAGGCIAILLVLFSTTEMTCCVLVASCGLFPCLFVRFSRANSWISYARFFSDCSRRRRIPALRSNRRGRASDSKRSSSLSAGLASGRRRNSAAVPENSGGAGGVLAASGARSVD